MTVLIVVMVLLAAVGAVDLLAELRRWWESGRHPRPVCRRAGPPRSVPSGTVRVLRRPYDWERPPEPTYPDPSISERRGARGRDRW